MSGYGLPPNLEVNSPLRWPGSKRRIARRIIQQMPPHCCYAEVFGGSGAVLMAKRRSTVEVYNDFDSNLVNFFEQCRDNRQALIQFLVFTPYSREVFEKWRETPIGDVADPVERAARFFYLNRNSFGAKMQSSGITWGYATTNSMASQYAEAIKAIVPFAKRMLSLQIEHRDWSQILKAYDRDDTLFYLDPPYYGAEDFYDARMAVTVHAEIAASLKDLKGKAMVSYYAHPAVDALYGKPGLNWRRIDFRIKKIFAKKNAADKEGNTSEYPVAHEVLYCNFPPVQTNFDFFEQEDDMDEDVEVTAEPGIEPITDGTCKELEPAPGTITQVGWKKPDPLPARDAQALEAEAREAEARAFRERVGLPEPEPAGDGSTAGSWEPLEHNEPEPEVDTHPQTLEPEPGVNPEVIAAPQERVVQLLPGVYLGVDAEDEAFEEEAVQANMEEFLDGLEPPPCDETVSSLADIEQSLADIYG